MKYACRSIRSQDNPDYAVKLFYDKQDNARGTESLPQMIGSSRNNDKKRHPYKQLTIKTNTNFDNDDQGRDRNNNAISFLRLSQNKHKKPETKKTKKSMNRFRTWKKDQRRKSLADSISTSATSSRENHKSSSHYAEIRHFRASTTKAPKGQPFTTELHRGNFTTPINVVAGLEKARIKHPSDMSLAEDCLKDFGSTMNPLPSPSRIVVDRKFKDVAARETRRTMDQFSQQSSHQRLHLTCSEMEQALVNETAGIQPPVPPTPQRGRQRLHGHQQQHQYNYKQQGQEQYQQQQMHSQRQGKNRKQLVEKALAHQEEKIKQQMTKTRKQLVEEALHRQEEKFLLERNRQYTGASQSALSVLTPDHIVAIDCVNDFVFTIAREMVQPLQPPIISVPTDPITFVDLELPSPKEPRFVRSSASRKRGGSFSSTNSRSSYDSKSKQIVQQTFRAEYMAQAIASRPSFPTHQPMYQKNGSTLREAAFHQKHNRIQPSLKKQDAPGPNRTRRPMPATPVKAPIEPPGKHMNHSRSSAASFVHIGIGDVTPSKTSITTDSQSQGSIKASSVSTHNSLPSSSNKSSGASISKATKKMSESTESILSSSPFDNYKWVDEHMPLHSIRSSPEMTSNFASIQTLMSSGSDAKTNRRKNLSSSSFQDQRINSPQPVSILKKKSVASVKTEDEFTSNVILKEPHSTMTGKSFDKLVDTPRIHLSSNASMASRITGASIASKQNEEATVISGKTNASSSQQRRFWARRPASTLTSDSGQEQRYEPLPALKGNNSSASSSTKSSWSHSIKKLRLPARPIVVSKYSFATESTSPNKNPETPPVDQAKGFVKDFCKTVVTDASTQTMQCKSAPMISSPASTRQGSHLNRAIRNPGDSHAESSDATPFGKAVGGFVNDFAHTMNPIKPKKMPKRVRIRPNPKDLLSSNRRRHIRADTPALFVVREHVQDFAKQTTRPMHRGAKEHVHVATQTTRPMHTTWRVTPPASNAEDFSMASACGNDDACDGLNKESSMSSRVKTRGEMASDQFRGSGKGNASTGTPALIIAEDCVKDFAKTINPKNTTKEIMANVHEALGQQAEMKSNGSRASGLYRSSWIACGY